MSTVDSPGNGGITFVPRIKLSPSIPQAGVFILEEQLLQSNHGWASQILAPPSFSYVVNPPQDEKEPKIVNYSNDFNLSSDDKEKVNQLDPRTIMQFIDRSSHISFDAGVVYEFDPISTGINTKIPTLPFLAIPPPLSSLDVSFLHIKLNNFGIHGTSTLLTNFTGILYLFDREKKLVISEAVLFSNKNGKLGFDQTSSNELYMEVRKCEPHIILVVVLMSEFAFDPLNYVGGITKGVDYEKKAPSPIPFAFSYYAPFAEKKETTFAFPFIIVTESDSIYKKINMEIEEDYQTYPIISPVSVTVLRRFDLPQQVCLASDTVRNAPLLALSIPQRAFDPTAIISLSGFSFSFNQSLKGDFVYFKVFLSEEPTEPNEPLSLPVFVSRGMGPPSNSYTSLTMITGKHVVFPDVVRILIDRPFKPTTHLIVHVMVGSQSDKTSNIYKVAVFPLFNELTEDIVQSACHSAYTHRLNDLKGKKEYLVRSKQIRKSSMAFYIDIPHALYPPEQFKPIIEALHPLAVQWTSILAIPPDQLLKQLLPITAKMLYLIFPITAEHLLNLFTLFKPEETKPPLRSWIYHNFDPTTIKNRLSFLSSFADAFDQKLNEAISIKSASLCNAFITYFDVITDIITVSYLRKTEDYIPESVFNLCKTVTFLIKTFADGNALNQITELNQQFGQFLFIFFSVSNEKKLIPIIWNHIKQLMNVSDTNFPNTSFLIWDFLVNFAQTNEFAIYLATQLPITPLNQIMFSPYHRIVSILCLAFDKTVNAENTQSIVLAAKFLTKFISTLEDLNHTLTYRAGYILFPFLENIPAYYDKPAFEQARLEIVPFICFLLAYSPRRLLGNYFNSLNTSFRSQFITFLYNVATTCHDELQPKCTLYNVLFDQITCRILQFLNFNITKYSKCLTSIDQVFSRLISPFQIPRNFPRMFDTLSRIIKYYPCQRELVTILLSFMSSNQHIGRCFATSLIILFFKADFDERKNVVVSSVEVLDSLTTLMRKSSVNDIKMYKLMLVRIKELAGVFNNDLFISKLNERINAANNISDTIEEIRLSNHPPHEMCLYVMQIADQYKTYPSMRIKWLKEIVQINQKNGSFASAFVAQLHICAVIATVIEHEQRLQAQVEEEENSLQFNLLLCQPIKTARAGSDKKVDLSIRDFEFFPSVLVETQIDFESISEDFRLISSDFELDYLRKAIDEAIESGKKAKLYYSLRCLYSLKLRFASSQRKYQEMSQIFKEFGQLYMNLTATNTSTHDTDLKFFKVNNKIYTVDPGNDEEFKKQNPEALLVNKFDKETNEMEHLHCWNVFRVMPSYEQVHSVDSFDGKNLTMIQYRTKEDLPRFTACSEILNKKEVVISLLDYARLETDRISRLIIQCSIEFEKYFPYNDLQKLSEICGDYALESSIDFSRISNLLKATFDGDASLTNLLLFLKDKGGNAYASEYAMKIIDVAQRLLKVYSRATEKSEIDRNNFEIIKSQAMEFQKSFNLPEIYFDKFEGMTDPLSQKFDFENY